jgi:CDP-paratose 2-epimerase
MPTVVFRGGCLTGPGHSGAELHGFLAYLMRCAATGRPYTVYGYKGKQVRDNIHSADLVRAFECVAREPRPGAVYNIGGGREINCSMIEAIELCESISGCPLDWRYVDRNRIGDHLWWIGDLAAFRADYPHWSPRYGIEDMLEEILDRNAGRWTSMEQVS